MPKPFFRQPSLNPYSLLALVLLVAGGAGLHFWHQRDPMKGETPAVVATLTDAKTVCEGRVRGLKEKGLDGSRQYDVAQRAANKCIDYRVGVIDQGVGNEAEMKRQLEDVSAKCNGFRQWADLQLNPEKIEGAEIDIAAATLAMVMEALDKQERRREVKNTLEKCKLPSWYDIPEVAGAREK